MSDWKILEDYVKSLLHTDKAKTTPLSGGTKGEEDVVGRTMIAQCKFTEKKNISILAKDLERLLNAAKLTEKFPLFASRSEAGTIISFPVTDETEDDIVFILKILSCLNTLRELKEVIPHVSTTGMIKGAQANLRDLKQEYAKIREVFTNLVNSIEQTIDAKYIDLTTYNLFDQEKNNAT